MRRDTCAYCEMLSPRVRSACPRTGEICEWCCDTCCAAQCARGVMMLSYHDPEKLALNLVLPVQCTEDEALALWRESYANTFKREPEQAMVDAARGILRQRLGGEAPPLPPSTSGLWPREPGLLYLLIEGDEDR